MVLSTSYWHVKGTSNLQRHSDDIKSMSLQRLIIDLLLFVLLTSFYDIVGCFVSDFLTTFLLRRGRRDMNLSDKNVLKMMFAEWVTTRV